MRRAIVLAVGLAFLAACGAAEKAAKITDATGTPAIGQSVSPAAPSAAAAPTSPATAIPTPSPASAKVSPKESGFASYKDSLGNINVAWGVVLENGSVTQQAVNTRVTVLFFDASNVVLKTADSTVAVIFPGQLSAAGDSLQMTAIPTRMEVRLAGTSFQTGQTTSALAVSDVALKRGSYDSTVSGKISSPFAKDIKDLKVICVVNAADGSYLGIGRHYLPLLPAASTTVAECSLDSRFKLEGGNARMFVSFSNITDIAP
jgi:hypothetical protein